MQDLIESIAKLGNRLNELQANFDKWKDNNGTVVVEKLVEVVKEVPVEVIKEVEKIVAPDTSELNAKVLSLESQLAVASNAIAALTSVAPVLEKAVDAVGEKVIEAAEAAPATPATDAFVATEPLVTEETAADIKEAVSQPVTEVKSE